MLVSQQLQVASTTDYLGFEFTRGIAELHDLATMKLLLAFRRSHNGSCCLGDQSGFLVFFPRLCRRKKSRPRKFRQTRIGLFQHEHLLAKAARPAAVALNRCQRREAAMAIAGPKGRVGRARASKLCSSSRCLPLYQPLKLPVRSSLTSRSPASSSSVPSPPPPSAARSSARAT